MVTTGYNAYLVETVTGQVGTRLSVVGNPSWNIEANGIETGSVTVLREDLKRVERKRFDTGFGSVLLTYTRPDGVEIPWVAGPIESHPSETRDTIEFAFRGIRSIYEKRLVTSDNALSVRRNKVYKGLSLGSIAQEVVKLSHDRPGGDLPIRFVSPYEKFSGDKHTRTYEWWNLANIKTHDVLTKLSDVRGGPDIMFRPEWANENKTHIVWAMYHGTEAQPAIAQNRVADFDMNSSDSGVIDWSLVSTGGHRTNRVWASGAGEGSGTFVRSAENLTSVEAGYPFFETVVSDPEITRDKGDRLDALAQAHVDNNQRMIDQLSLTISADHRKNPFGSWFVGDTINVTTVETFSIPAGTYRMRVIAASGGDEGRITLELQEDTW